MSPAPTTRSEFMPSTSTAYSTNDHTITHTNPSITSIWTILALTFVVVVVSGVFCYSIYNCYCTAAYQRELEITESMRQRARAESPARRGLSTNGEPDDDLKGRPGFEVKRSDFNAVCNHSITTFQSSSTMPDITSPPLAVTYSTHTPYMHHALPISPLPSTEYESVKLSPGPPAPMFFDSNSIPYYIPEMPHSPLIGPKLAPVAGPFNLGSERVLCMSSLLTSDASTSDTQEFAAVTAVCPRPLTTSIHVPRKRAPSLVDGNLDPFARTAPSMASVIILPENSDFPVECSEMQELRKHDRKQSCKTFDGKPSRNVNSSTHQVRSVLPTHTGRVATTLQCKGKLRKPSFSKTPPSGHR